MSGFDDTLDDAAWAAAGWWAAACLAGPLCRQWGGVGRIAAPIRHASAFATTVEKPGGVVVSSRERFPLITSLP